MSQTAPSALVTALLQERPTPGSVVRIARTAAGWSQGELGQRCGYSASQISRWETGRLPLRDVAMLRILAKVLDLPPEVFGLADGHTTKVPSRSMSPSSHKVGQIGTSMQKGDDPVRRRTFLLAAGLAGSSLALPQPALAALSGKADPAELLASQLAKVLVGHPPATEPVTIPVLHEALVAARGEFLACRYVPLATGLPALIATAQTAVAEHAHPMAHQVLAETYNLATRALIKLQASGLEGISADRALRAARVAEDPLTLAESERLVASVARRAGHHNRAQTLTLAAAAHLDTSGRRPEHLAMYGMLHCSAGYAAARASDRDRASDLLAEAEATAVRLAYDRGRHQALIANIVSHRVSSAYVLGDAGMALAHARILPLAAIPTTERRARLLVDTALAYAQWDKPDFAYRTLLAAERMVPGEVHTRNAVRRLVNELMASPRQAAMLGLPALATRVHAST